MDYYEHNGSYWNYINYCRNYSCICRDVYSGIRSTGNISCNMSGGRCDPEYDNYLVCGELLFQFLVWLDPIFVSNLYVQMNEDNKINEAVQDIYRSKEIENTIPSIVYCIYNKGLFGKYKPKELIDLLYSCKDMTVTEVLTPRNITKVLHTSKVSM